MLKRPVKPNNFALVLIMIKSKYFIRIAKGIGVLSLRCLLFKAGQLPTPQPKAGEKLESDLSTRLVFQNLAIEAQLYVQLCNTTELSVLFLK